MSAAARAAIREVFRDTSGDLLAYFERRVAEREEAADLLAQTMLTAWRRVEKIPDDPERRRMWLFVVAAHTLANHRRGHRRRLAMTERLRAHLALAAPGTEPGEAHAVRDAVQRLPARQRELVMLVHWDGLSITQAAEVLGVNASTARTRYAAAKQSLRLALAECSRA